MLPIVAAKRAEMVRSDHALNDYVRLMPTPGHTPDHFAVLVGRGGDDGVMTGDLIHSPLQARYPELSMRADIDQAQSAADAARASWSALRHRRADLHGAFPLALDRPHRRRWGEGFRCDPVEP